MLTTSVSLPMGHTTLWRRHYAQIMRYAADMLADARSKMPLRRGVTRLYNRRGRDYAIVTSRFSEAEYDTLHCAASALRVSVSWLIERLITLWLNRIENRRPAIFTTNYSINTTNSDNTILIFTECIAFSPRGDYHDGKQLRLL